MPPRGSSIRSFLCIEGSVPNEKIKKEGYWAAMGTDPDTGQPITTNEWIDRLCSKSAGDRRLRHLRDLRRHPRDGRQPHRRDGTARIIWAGVGVQKPGLPIVNVPGCPVQPDNMMETLLYLLYQVAGLAPMIPLDEQLRPTWLFGKTVHEGCDRAGYYEQGDFAHEYGSPKCLVKIGCWGPVVNCNVTKRGWMAGIGGCPNVGGICIGCTMPGFPDKFMPFMDAPPGSALSTKVVGMWGGVATQTARASPIRPSTRSRNGVIRVRELTTGYEPQKLRAQLNGASKS